MKWGVGRKEDGGTVTLMTRKTPLGAEITVSDDGVGFDPEQPPQDGKEHVGLQLVRDRLQMVCGAKLTTQSKIGQGTLMRVLIPYSCDETAGCTKSIRSVYIQKICMDRPAREAAAFAKNYTVCAELCKPPLFWTHVPTELCGFSFSFS